MAANFKNHPPHYYTLEEYSALEQGSDARFEYWDGEIVCMSGGTLQHSLISDNCYALLRESLKGRPCRAFTGRMPIKTPSLPPYRYPDASVVCGGIVTEKVNGIDTLVNPVLVVEVLSPGTELVDHNQKKAAYQALPSLHEYLMFWHDMPHVTQFVREGESWVRQDYGDLRAVVPLASVNCQLALSEVYDGVIFS
jgi:Uma2 family endonuclease